ITKIGKKQLDQKIKIGSIFELDLKDYTYFKPTFDIYNHLALLKITGKEENISKLKFSYIAEIKKLVMPNGSIGDLITESSRALLIIDLLDLRKNEEELWNNLLNYILTKTRFFGTENLDSSFNWRNDPIAFNIELQMLYSVLLACSSYRSN
ncbi:MAG: hypothetical protein R3255_10280, partial [Candidatus Lokiarchaeia archaeon]|nr:hypothetical protein [Candidatus Lokiarchaeia archaeon]